MARKHIYGIVDKRYYQKNRDKILKHRREYCKKNKEEIRIKKKKWRQKNREKVNAQKRAIYHKDKKKILAQGKTYRNKNKKKIKETGKKYYKNNKKSLKLKSKKYYHKNKKKITVKKNEYYNKNKKNISKKSKEYCNKNKELIRKRRFGYEKNRAKIDTLFKLTRNIRSLLGHSFKNNGFKKNTKTEKIIGCTFMEFKNHIESQFLPWMNWNNHGKYNGKLNFGWDLDHIIPPTSAKTEEEIIKLNHHANLQPLCSYTNRYIKADKLDFYPSRRISTLRNKLCLR